MTLDAVQQRIVQDLAAAGFDLCTFLALESLVAAGALSETVLRELPGGGPDARYLLLVGNGGGRLWQTMREKSALAGADPVDRYSQRQVIDCLNRHVHGGRWWLLFPVPGRLPEAGEKNRHTTRADADPPASDSRILNLSTPLPLQRLGQIAGWHSPSPLGLGINTEFGLWSAYRAVALVEGAFKDNRLPAQPSPCLDCRLRPCLSACPVGALDQTDPPDVPVCYTYRASPDSACARTCLARYACPHAAEHQYPSSMTAHFYKKL